MTVTEFMAAARQLTRAGQVDDNTLDRLGALLAQLGQDPGLLHDERLRALHGSDSVATVLATGEDGLTLMLAKFSDKAETPVHDHNSWGVACVIRGRDQYRHWQLVEGTPESGRARLKPLFERVLSEGEYVHWQDPPADIHSQQGVGAPAWELVLFGRDPTKIERHYFDVATGTVRTALPQ